MTENGLAISVSDLLNNATVFEITTHEQYQTCCSALKDDKALIKKVEAGYRPIIEKAHSAHKEAIAQMNVYLKPLEEAEMILKSKAIAWIKSNSDNLDAVPKIEGISFAKRNKWELIDISKVNPQFLKIDDAAVTKAVNSLGATAMEVVGGISVFQDLNVSIKI